MGRLIVLCCCVIAVGPIVTAAAPLTHPGVTASQSDIGSLSLVRTGDDGSVCFGHFGNTILCLYPDFTNPLVDGSLMGDINVRLGGLQDIAVVDATEVVVADRASGALWRLTDSGGSTRITGADQFPGLNSVDRFDAATFVVTEAVSGSGCGAWLLTDGNADGRFAASEATCLMDAGALGGAFPVEFQLESVNPRKGALIDHNGTVWIGEDQDSDGTWSATEVAPFVHLHQPGVDLTRDGAGRRFALTLQSGSGGTSVWQIADDVDGDGLADGPTLLYEDTGRLLTSFALTDPTAGFAPYLDFGSGLYLEDAAMNTEVTVLEADTSVTPTPTASPASTSTPTSTPEPTPTSTPSLMWTPSPTPTPSPPATPTPTQRPQIFAAGWLNSDLSAESGGMIELWVLGRSMDEVGVVDTGGTFTPLPPTSVSTNDETQVFFFGPFAVGPGGVSERLFLELFPRSSGQAEPGLAWPALSVTP